MTTIKTLYKGITYTVVMRGKDLAYAKDANGYTVTDSKTIQALALITTGELSGWLTE